MEKRRNRKPNLIPMKVGVDSSLWRYASLEEALSCNVDLIAGMIKSGEENLARASKAQADDSDVA